MTQNQMDGADGIIYEQRRITPERYQVVAMRKSQAALERTLRPEFIDAMHEIEWAFNADCVVMGYQTMDILGVRGGGAYEHASVDLINKIQKARAIFKEWARQCEGPAYGIALDVCVFGFTVNQVSENRAICKKTVTANLKKALNEWCILRGWGNFLKTE